MHAHVYLNPIFDDNSGKIIKILNIFNKNIYIFFSETSKSEIEDLNEKWTSQFNNVSYVLNLNSPCFC